jgi:hypothetical protein
VSLRRGSAATPRRADPSLLDTLRIDRPVPSRQRKENRMTFTIKLERADGTPAEPPSIGTTVTNWRPGDTIPLGAKKSLRGHAGTLDPPHRSFLSGPATRPKSV